MALISKSGTYTERGYEKPWWKEDPLRLGFDPPEEKEAKEREKEWKQHYIKQKPQIEAAWDSYEKDPSTASLIRSARRSDRDKDKDNKDKGDKQKEKEDPEKDEKKLSGGLTNILSNVSSAIKPNIKKLVRHGIPYDLRATLWFEKSGASQKKNDNPGVYAKYVAEMNADAPVMEEIQMDIARTFTMHLMFANALTKKMMLRILSAFTIRNPNYGYCQNMTFIVAVILFFLPEEDGFWLFVTIMEDILPVDFCSPTLIGLRVDQKILEVLVKERLPKLASHFAKQNIDISCFTTSWLLRLFVNVFPIETTLRIWDCFLFEGSKILFRVALAFLKLHDEQMKQCEDSGAVMTFLSTECKMFYDADKLIKACASFWALRRRQINELRTRFIEELSVGMEDYPNSNSNSNSEANSLSASADSNGVEEVHESAAPPLPPKSVNPPASVQASAPTQAPPQAVPQSAPTQTLVHATNGSTPVVQATPTPTPTAQVETAPVQTSLRSSTQDLSPPTQVPAVQAPAALVSAKSPTQAPASSQAAEKAPVKAPSPQPPTQAENIPEKASPAPTIKPQSSPQPSPAEKPPTLPPKPANSPATLSKSPVSSSPPQSSQSPSTLSPTLATSPVQSPTQIPTLPPKPLPKPTTAPAPPTKMVRPFHP